jgi:hypothetical protein
MYAVRMTNELVRLNVNLNQPTADALKVIAVRDGITFTEAIRRAISLLSFVESEVDAGRVVQTQNSDGTRRRELVLM